MTTGVFREASEEELQHLRDDPINGVNIFNAIQQPVFILDTKHNILAANAVTRHVTGQSDKELTGRKCYEILHQVDRPPAGCPLRKVLTGGKAETADMEVQAFQRHFLVHCSPVFGKDGSIERIIHIANDITERKAAEEKLRENEERFRLIADYTYSLEWWRDADGSLLWLNPAVERMTGYSVAECHEMRKFPLEITHEEDRQSMQSLLGEMIHREHNGRDHELRIYHKNGSVRWMVVSWQPVFDAGGRHRGFRLSARDITDQKGTLDALKESEEMYRELFEKGSDLLCLHDLEGNIIETNLAFKKEYGWSEAELLKMNLEDLISEQYRHEFKDYLHRILENGSDEGVLAMDTKEGRDLIVEYCGILVYDSHGNPIGVKGSAKDITEKIRMQREKKKLQEQVRRVQKMEAIGTLTGGIAHEFNNILGIILGNTELAIDKIDTHSSILENMEQIKGATLRATNIVRQLLSFSRKSEQRRNPLRIAPIVKEAVRFIRNSVPASIEINEEITRDAHMISGDPSQIQQLLINLLTNAAEAMQERGGKLVVRLKNEVLEEKQEIGFQRLKPGHYVRLEVTDTGCGIEPDLMEKVFDPYFTTKGLGLGRGMGLTVAHSIVRDHDGAIHFETKAGEGSTFSVVFPAVMEGPDLPTEASETLTGGTERILVLDDEEQLARLMKIILERLGYDVEASTDPVKALELMVADPHRFDLVITDMTMPHIAGDHVALELLRIRPDMPIILCTGYNQKIDEEKANAMGIRAYLEKPLDRKRLAATVRQALDSNRRS